MFISRSSSNPNGFDNVTTVTTLCAICQSPGIQACKSCHAIHYCTTTCEKIDWPVHNLVCKAFTKDKRPVPVDPNVRYKRVIFFPTDLAPPRFVWLPYHTSETHGGVIIDTSPLKLENTFGWSKRLDYNEVLRRPLARPINILAVVHNNDGTFPESSGKPNRSMVKISEQLEDFWRGPLYAFGTERIPMEEGHDLDVMDFRHVVDFIRHEHYTAVNDTAKYTLGDGRKVQGLRLGCHGEGALLRRRNYERVNVLESFCQRDGDLATPVAEKAGIPLVMLRVPRPLLFRDGRSHRGTRCTDNPHAASLDPKTFFDADLYPDLVKEGETNDSENIGTVIVVRKDGKPLHPFVLQALLEYTGNRSMFAPPRTNPFRPGQLYTRQDVPARF